MAKDRADQMTQDTTVKVLVPPMCFDAMEFQAAQKEGAYPGAKFIRRYRGALEYELSTDDAEELRSECYERSGPDWCNEPSEKAAFRKLMRRLEAALKLAKEAKP